MKSISRMIVLVSLFLFLPSIFQMKITAEERQDTALFYEAQALLEKKKPEEAIPKFREILDRFPESNLRDLTWFWIGQSYWETGRGPEAEESLGRLQSEFPDSPLIQKLRTVLAKQPSSPGTEKPASSSPPRTAQKPPAKKPSVKPGPSTRADEPLPAPAGKGFSLIISQVAGVHVELQADEVSVYPGETGLIPFLVTNSGNASDGFRLSVNLPVDYQPAFHLDGNANGRLDEGEGTIQEIPSLGIRQSVRLLLETRLPHSVPDGLRREVEISVSSKFDPNISQLAKANLVTKGPLLKADLSASEQGVRPGAALSYALDVSNVGSAEARNVKIQHLYHPNLIFLSAEPNPQIVEQAGRTLVWNIGNLASQGKKRIKVNFKVGDEAMAGTQLVNRGSIETSLGNDPVTFLTPLVTVQQVAMVKLEASGEDLYVTPGDNIYLPVTIHNLGNGRDAFLVKINGTEALTGTVYGDLNGDGIHQDSEPTIEETPSLGTREAFPALVRLAVPVQGSDRQKIQVGLTAMSKLDRNTASDINKSIYFMVPIVYVSTQASARESVPGGIISYQILAINQGSGIARNVTVRDLLPAELEFVNSDPKPSQTQEGKLIWKMEELAPNQKKVFVVNVMTRPSLKAGTVIQKETHISYTDLNGNRYE